MTSGHATPGSPTPRRRLSLLIALVLVAGACSSSNSDSASRTTEVSEPSSSADTAGASEESPPSDTEAAGDGQTGVVSPARASDSGECSSPPLEPAAASVAEQLAGAEEEQIDETAAQRSVLAAGEIVDRAEPGVVIITAIAPAAEDDGNVQDGSEDDAELAIETGSGAVVNDAGLIVTNRHVVEGAEVVVAQGVDNRIRDAAVLGVISGDGDLALIEVVDAVGLEPIELGSSDEVGIGEPVLALGSPVDVGLSVSSGVLSGRGRNIRVEDAALFDLLQTDAAINPGNSGGPLLDQTGRLIGVNTAVVEAEGVGFAIPVEQVKRFIEAATTGVPTPTIGVQFVTMTAERIAESGAPVLAGARAVAVGEDGPAGEAGLLDGDVVTEANGQPVYTVTEMNESVVDVGVEGALALLVCREAQQGSWSDVEVDITVGGRDVTGG